MWTGPDPMDHTHDESLTRTTQTDGRTDWSVKAWANTYSKLPYLHVLNTIIHTWPTVILFKDTYCKSTTVRVGVWWDYWTVIGTEVDKEAPCRFSHSFTAWHDSSIKAFSLLVDFPQLPQNLSHHLLQMVPLTRQCNSFATILIISSCVLLSLM